MKEWTSVINEENLKNPKWNIYLYSFSDGNGNGFKVGKADKSVRIWVAMRKKKAHHFQ